MTGPALFFTRPARRRVASPQLKVTATASVKFVV
jgi:hypothetical protein